MDINSNQFVNQREAYENLATAIIKQAIYDYETLKGGSLIEGNRMMTTSNIKRFFYSEWFHFLANADGALIVRQIDENFDKYGYCILRDKDIK